jgi:type II secretory pathway component PulL
MSRQRARLTDLSKAETAVWQQATGEDAPQTGVYAAFQARLIELERGANERAMGGRAAPILKALYVISKTAPAGGTIECQKFNATPGAVTISASARDEATVEKLVKDVVAEGTFAAESRGLRKAEDGVRFELIMSPKRGGNVR